MSKKKYTLLFIMALTTYILQDFVTVYVHNLIIAENKLEIADSFYTKITYMRNALEIISYCLVAAIIILVWVKIPKLSRKIMWSEFSIISLGCCFIIIDAIVVHYLFDIRSSFILAGLNFIRFNIFMMFMAAYQYIKRKIK